MYGRINTACMDRQKKARCPSITKTPSNATRGRTTTRAQGANPARTRRGAFNNARENSSTSHRCEAPGHATASSKQCARRNGRWQCHRPAPAPGFLRNMPTGSGRERTARTGPVTRSSQKRPGRYKPNQAQAPQRSHSARRATGTSSAQRQRDGMHTKRKSRAKNTGISTRARATHNK